MRQLWDWRCPAGLPGWEPSVSSRSAPAYASSRALSTMAMQEHMLQLQHELTLALSLGTGQESQVALGRLLLLATQAQPTSRLTGALLAALDATGGGNDEPSIAAALEGQGLDRSAILKEVSPALQFAESQETMAGMWT